MRTSLSALLAVVILCTAARADEADEADAVKLIETLCGTVKRDDKQLGKPISEVNLSSTAVGSFSFEKSDLKMSNGLTMASAPSRQC